MHRDSGRAHFADFNKLQAEILRRASAIGLSRITSWRFIRMEPAQTSRKICHFFMGQLSITGLSSSVMSVTAHGRSRQHLLHARPYGQLQQALGVMELQPGHVNWSPYPVCRIRRRSTCGSGLHSPHGAEFVATYRYRQPRFGYELFHDGLVGTDGLTPTPVAGNCAGSDELKHIDKKLWIQDTDKIDPKRTIGLLFDFDQLWYYQTLPQAKRWDQAQWLRLWYAAAVRLGLNIRVLHPQEMWPEEIKVVVAGSADGGQRGRG